MSHRLSDILAVVKTEFDTFEEIVVLPLPDASILSLGSHVGDDVSKLGFEPLCKTLECSVLGFGCEEASVEDCGALVVMERTVRFSQEMFNTPLGEVLASVSEQLAEPALLGTIAESVDVTSPAVFGTSAVAEGASVNLPVEALDRLGKAFSISKGLFELPFMVQGSPFP